MISGHVEDLGGQGGLHVQVQGRGAGGGMFSSIYSSAPTLTSTPIPTSTAPSYSIVLTPPPMQARRNVDLDQPRFQPGVEQDIETKQLEAGISGN